MANMVDTVVYHIDKHPAESLKAIYVSHGVPATLRRALADCGVLSVELFASLADTQGDTIKRLEERFRQGKFADNEIEARREKLALQATWTSAKGLAQSTAAAEVRYAEDPSKIPVIPETDRLRMRRTWVLNHKELLLDDHCEPHPKFLDMIRRDWRTQPSRQL